MQQAEREADIAQRREAQLIRDVNVTATALLAWEQEVTVARVPVAGSGLLAIDVRDKQVYYASRGGIHRAHYAPGAVLTPAERILSLGTISGLYLHEETARLYWVAQSGAGSEVRRSYLDGTQQELVLDSLPRQSRVVAAAIGGAGRLSTVYVAVSQPGNASLLLYLEAKTRASDETPARVVVSTLLRGVAPTALVVHGDHFFYTVAVSRSLHRCELDGTDCVTLQSSVDSRPLPWFSVDYSNTTAPSTASAPAGLSIDKAGAHGLVWIDSAARRVVRSTLNGSSAEALWWTRITPEAVKLYYEAPATDGLDLPPRPLLLGLQPLGGPTAGGTALTLHGVALGRVGLLRYAPEQEWISNQSAGLAVAFLPICNRECPQTYDEIQVLTE